MIVDHYVGFRVRTRTQLEAHWRAFLARHWFIEPRGFEGEPLVAYVNHGRWVADCPCGSGLLCSPRDEDACCLECGLVHRVAFPEPSDIDAATQILMQRPRRNRNWYPVGEQVSDLAAENAAHGLRGS